MRIKIKKTHPEAVIPKYATPGSAGFDLVAVEDVIIAPGETKLVRTGLVFEIPEGYEIQVRPRSGVTLKTKLRVQLGTIDADYRGEIGVIIDNLNHVYLADGWGPLLKGRANLLDGTDVYDYEGKELIHGTYIIRKGDRIAQAVISPVIQADFEEGDELSETERGEGGFGSTGTN